MGRTPVIDAHVADGARACLDVAKARSRAPAGSDASRYARYQPQKTLELSGVYSP